MTLVVSVESLSYSIYRRYLPKLLERFVNPSAQTRTLINEIALRTNSVYMPQEEAISVIDYRPTIFF